MEKVILLLLISLQFLHLKAQNNCDFEQAEKEILQLIKQHEELMPEKQFGKLSILKIEQGKIKNQKILNTQNIIKFTFMGNNILRFYTYSSGVDARVLLKQRKGGFFEKEDEKTLLDVINKGDDNGITFYDYEIKEHNDFLLTFLPTNSQNGCALLVFYHIIDKEVINRRYTE